MLSNPIVHVTVIPQPSNVTLTYEGKSYNMEREGMQWTINLQNATEGTHKIDIKPADAESSQMTINIVGVSGNTNINEMFDL